MNENVQGYTVRGEIYKYINLYRERVRDTERESPSVEKVDTIILQEKMTREGYLVYYATKVNNLQRYCVSKNVLPLK